MKIAIFFFTEIEHFYASCLSIVWIMKSTLQSFLLSLEQTCEILILPYLYSQYASAVPLLVLHNIIYYSTIQLFNCLWVWVRSNFTFLLPTTEFFILKGKWFQRNIEIWVCNPPFFLVFVLVRIFFIFFFCENLTSTFLAFLRCFFFFYPGS